MIIDTVFNLKDELWTMDCNRPRKFYVEKIEITSNICSFSGKVFIKLYLNAYNDKTNYYQINRMLGDCFKTKEDLLKSL